MAITFLPLILLLTMATAAVAESPVIVRLRGNFGFAPATVIVTARVERHADNRQICLVVTDGGYETSSCRPHIGTNAPLQVVFEPIRNLSQGEYVAFVEVERVSPEGNVTHVRDKQNFHILDPIGG